MYEKEIESKDKEIESKDKEIESKDKEIKFKDKAIADKDAILTLTREKLADANLKYLLALGDISIRGVVESIEKDSIYKETKAFLKKLALPGDKFPDTRRLTWEAILKQPEKSSRFQHLKTLAEEVEINVAEAIVSLHRTSSKGIHNAIYDEVLIDVDSLSRNEVSFSC
jgi:hypothetical protein